MDECNRQDQDENLRQQVARLAAQCNVAEYRFLTANRTGTPEPTERGVCLRPASELKMSLEYEYISERKPFYTERPVQQ